MTTPEQTVAMTLLAVAVIVAVARMLGMLARRVHQPAVVGEIVAGIALGPSLLGALTWGGASLDDRLFPEPVQGQLQALANLGLVIFMFVVGLELDLSRVRSQRRRAVSISVSSVALPMAAAAFLSILLWAQHGPGGDTAQRVAFALFIGVAMAVTAFPVLARILTERHMQQTAIGSLALASAAIDDVLAWSLLAVATTLAGTGGQPAWLTVSLVAAFLAAMLLGVRPVAGLLVGRYERAGRLTPDVFGAVLVGVLLCAWVTGSIGVHFIFGAFLFGCLFPRSSAGFREALLARLEDISVLVLLPVFFVISGLNVDLTGLGAGAALLLVLVIGLACATKFLGSYAAARATGVQPRAASALGVLMNTRGLTELVVVNVGFMVGLLDRSLFTIFIVMAVVTTMMTEPLLRRVYPAELVRRDIAAAEQAALGTVPAYRVLVALSGRPADAVAVRTACWLAAAQRPGRVLLSRVVAAGSPGELGSGLSLDAVADALEGPPCAIPPLPDRVETVPLVRTGEDPAAEWSSQAGALDVAAVVVAGDGSGTAAGKLLASCPARVLVVHGPESAHEAAPAVMVHGAAGAETKTVADVALRLGAARALPVVVVADRRPVPHRVAGWVRAARSRGLGVAVHAGEIAPPRDSVLVAPADAQGLVEPGQPAVLVRAGATEPVDVLDQTLELLTASDRPEPALQARRPAEGTAHGRHR